MFLKANARVGLAHISGGYAGLPTACEIGKVYEFSPELCELLPLDLFEEVSAPMSDEPQTPAEPQAPEVTPTPEVPATEPTAPVDQPTETPEAPATETPAEPQASAVE